MDQPATFSITFGFTIYKFYQIEAGARGPEKRAADRAKRICALDDREVQRSPARVFAALISILGLVALI
jgi:hypothetical protein